MERLGTALTASDGGREGRKDTAALAGGGAGGSGFGAYVPGLSQSCQAAGGSGLTVRGCGGSSPFLCLSIRAAASDAFESTFGGAGRGFGAIGGLDKAVAYMGNVGPFLGAGGCCSACD